MRDHLRCRRPRWRSRDPLPRRSEANKRRPSLTSDRTTRKALHTDLRRPAHRRSISSITFAQAALDDRTDRPLRLTSIGTSVPASPVQVRGTSTGRSVPTGQPLRSWPGTARVTAAPRHRCGDCRTSLHKPDAESSRVARVPSLPLRRESRPPPGCQGSNSGRQAEVTLPPRGRSLAAPSDSDATLRPPLRWRHPAAQPDRAETPASAGLASVSADAHLIPAGDDRQKYGMTGRCQHQ